ncbi:hypothetical protein CAEBREN_01650 [Caenorhabditis brenneri]|uniref:Uncharacterized protein n=1 Tax=Caenorhabditis brenneri TaxID=135651 RepID=G0NWD1_CAEBE|nr:hypothetical protein CAEBREN_01650 [Caenorhabditis brenneri]
MCDRNQQHCDDKRDHKEQGMHQDIGDLTNMFNKNDQMRQGHHEMEGNIHGLRMDQSGNSAEQKKLNQERMQGFSDKKECDGSKKCGMKDESH